MTADTALARRCFLAPLSCTHLHGSSGRTGDVSGQERLCSCNCAGRVIHKGRMRPSALSTAWHQPHYLIYRFVHAAGQHLHHIMCTPVR
jgi:hypothetical protein